MSGGLADNGWKWKGSLLLTHVGMLGMTIALLIAGYEQAFIERAAGGSTWSAFFEAQNQPWFIQAMWWCLVFGILMTIWCATTDLDFLRIGAHETRPIMTIERGTDEVPSASAKDGLTEAAVS